MNCMYPGGQKPNRVACHKGFTLLEVMTVVFIIGVILTFASLSIEQNEDHRVRDEAERIQHLLQLVSEEAVLQGRELALQLNRQGYQFVSLEGDKWQPVADDKLLRQREFPELFTLELSLWGKPMNLEDKDKPARILLLSSGEITPFQLLFKMDNGETYQLQGNLTGKLALYAPGEAPEEEQ
jgi:general secretion pathway protein H